MTSSRIASAVIAPALAALLAIACSTSDNNGGTGAGGSGPKEVSAGSSGASSSDGGSSSGGKGGSSSGGKGGSSSSGKGGTDPGTGGTDPGTDPAVCQEQCVTDNAAGIKVLNDSALDSCGCKAGAACEAECKASCGGTLDKTCADCVNGLTGDACIQEATKACQASPDCLAAVTCLQGCGTGGGGGGGGDACVQQCGKDNQAGVATYNQAADSFNGCLCDTTCKADCSADPICTTQQPQASQACQTCSSSCADAADKICNADADCKALQECINACPLAPRPTSQAADAARRARHPTR
jgi:hypothetical protein